MRPRNLYARLLLWFVAANVLTLAVSIAVTGRLARLAYENEPDWAELARAADAAWREGGTPALEAWTEHAQREGIEAVLLENGQLLSPRPPPPMLRRWLPQLDAEDSIVLRPRKGLAIASERVVGSDGVARRLVAARLPRPPPPRLGLLMLIQALMSLPVIGLLGWWVARSIARPVGALQEAARRMGGGDLAARVGEPWSRRGDEIGRLAADFDGMAARIEALVAHERRVLQDLSHELRSPLARLHLLLDAARRGQGAGSGATADSAFDRAEREVERLDRLIGEALALSRMEAQLPGAAGVSRVALGPLLRARVADARLEAGARGVELAEPVIDEGLEVAGDAALLGRAIDNLLSNAIKFSPAGGRVEATLSAAPGEARLAVRDHGPGVPEAELVALFRPFFRGSNAPRADGHGLGLAIVERVLRAHGGSAQAANAPGGGLCVELRLPLAGAAG